MISEERLQHFLQRMPAGAILVAVSKYTDSAQIRLAYKLGVRHFGESRVQDAERKREELVDLTDIEWHFIGKLQTNKARKAVQIFNWIHSVDSLELLEKLNIVACEEKKKPNLLLQVKLAPDPNKGGFTEAELWDNLPLMFELSCLPIKGLMTILPLGLDSDERYRMFCKLAELKEQINSHFKSSLDELSMGMSGDCEEALRAGASILRIGKAIFV